MNSRGETRYCFDFTEYTILKDEKSFDESIVFIARAMASSDNINSSLHDSLAERTAKPIKT